MAKDVLYDTLNREDPNWRKYHEQIAYKAVRTFQPTVKKAFVIDDAVIRRLGKKMPGLMNPMFNPI